VTGVVFGMLGLSFAAVPLYDLFCRTTGYGGTADGRTEAAKTIGTKTYTVRFDAGVAPGLLWRFEAEQAERSASSRAGDDGALHRPQHRGDRDTGIASFNVLPEITGGYFNKLECFCFTEQTPEARRKPRGNVWCSSSIRRSRPTEALAHIDTITLSYTFHPAKQPAKPLAANSTISGTTVR
jgi:cytochrome c oxidase assembly protein subunit 11